jgi:hypothetical protein
MSLLVKSLADVRWITLARASGIVWLILFGYSILNVATGPGTVTTVGIVWNALMVISGLWLVIRPTGAAVMLGLAPAALAALGVWGNCGVGRPQSHPPGGHRVGGSGPGRRTCCLEKMA